jgi:ketosteroid isomerase-like protein
VEFRNAMDKSYPGFTTSPQFNADDLGNWAGGKLFEAAPKAANIGPSSTGADVKKGLYALKNETLGGLTGPLNFTAGKPSFVSCYFGVQVKAGRFESLNGNKPICLSAAEGAALLKALHIAGSFARRRGWAGTFDPPSFEVRGNVRIREGPLRATKRRSSMTIDARTPERRAVEDLFDGMRTADLELVMSRIHADIEVVEADSVPYYGGTFSGKEAFQRDLLGQMLSNYDLAVNSTIPLETDDGRIIGLLDLTFTSRETGRSLRMRIVEIYTVRDDQIINIDVYYKDTAAMAAAFPEGCARPLGARERASEFGPAARS